MLILISPAKTLDLTPQAPHAGTKPQFLTQANRLAKLAKTLPPAKLAKLMSISPQLAEKTHSYFASWKAKYDAAGAKEAIFAFRGDVYLGLEAWALSEADLAFAQDHLRILSGLRVSSVLTSFLLWPVFLACLMPVGFWPNMLTMLAYFLIVGLTAVTTAITALFCSTVFKKSSSSLMCSYLVLATMFLAPVAANIFVQTFAAASGAAGVVTVLQAISPFAAAFNLPLSLDEWNNANRIDVRIFWGFLAFTAVYNGGLMLLMTQLFKVRWRVSE